MRAVGEKTALLSSGDDNNGSLLPGDWAPVPTPPKHDDNVSEGGERRRQRQERPRRLPQAIAHRGYSAVAPENTIEAFRRAVKAGAHALETDLRLSRDGVVVLMHDASLKRTFGEDSKVRDHDWSYLSRLRTLRKPRQPMARLVDLLEYLNEPGLEHVWVMLDIKRPCLAGRVADVSASAEQRDGDPGEMLRRVAAALDSVPAARGARPWRDRVLVCCWSAAFARQGARHLPGFRLAHVGFSTTYSRALLRHGLVSAVSALRFSPASPLLGARFIRDMRRAGVPLFVWTVNDEAWMRWAVRRRLDGVITDDPKLFLEVCGRMVAEGGEGGDGPDGSGGHDGAKREARGPLRKLARGAKFCAQVLLVEVLHFIWLIYLFWQHGGVDKEVGKSLEA
ncbi:hypothetical protein DL766_004456 [Monosporascus sp. MC13-8B]|uniref:GP-PDE domain-containing protein n=1 Tax=Monosporascus cannonballus TaxID=155416 RepID=A0ABY0H2F9_9PEZI|nr:hypothetical protein DL762_006290 [Monosporascus cannonballus]RYP01381.1 hypothetical protein DL763_000191 [Monosporascus cannonballus]RYP31273.1 hypothetical protein DL766_004456 [Monosporascus sp. MC13-8B]